MGSIYPAGSLQVDFLSTLSKDGPSIPSDSDKVPVVNRSDEHRSVTPPKISSLVSIANINRRISAGTQSSRHSIESWREESLDAPRGGDPITQEVESSA